MKKYLLYILISLCTVFASCEKYLDVTPKTQVPEEDLFSQVNGYEDALVGCFIKMNSENLYGVFLSMCGIDYMAQYYNQMSSSSSEQAYRDFDYLNTTVETQFKYVYNEFYNIILQANDILINIDSEKGKTIVKDEYKRNIIKGEALALRAFCHFDILRIFGQLPQNATIAVSLPYSETIGVEDRPLYAYEQFVEKIRKDLTDALQLLENDPVKVYSSIYYTVTDEMIEKTPQLDDDFYTYRKFRFNYYAVKALMARFCLYIGETENAYNAAMEIINAKSSNGGNMISLGGNYDFSKGYFTLPSETLMALSNAEMENMTSALNKLFKSDNLADAPMRFTDERKGDLFQGRNTGSNNRYTQLWGKFTTVQGNSLPYLRKYFQNEVSATDSEKLSSRWQIPLLRLSEVYLIAMECSNDLDKINDMFYTYMVARNEQPAPFASLEEVKAEIMNEYRREFIAEGQMFFTYKRLASESMKWRTGKIVESNYIVPVPSSEQK